MPKTIKIKLPDGSERSKEFPDSMSRDDIKAAIQQEYKQSEAPEQKYWKDVERTLRNVMAGTAQNSQNLLNTIPGVEKYTDQIFPTKEQYEQFIGIPEAQQTTGDKFAQLSPEILGALTLNPLALGRVGAKIASIPKVGQYLKTALSNALSQGLYTGALTPENKTQTAAEVGGIVAPFSALSQGVLSKSPLLNTVSRIGLGSALGAGLGYGAHEAGLPPWLAGGLGAAGFGLGLKGSPRARLSREISKEVDKFPEAQERIEASRRRGLPYITPLEATGSGILAAKEGKLSVNPHPAAADIIARQGEKRVAAETKTINNALETIFPAAESGKIGDLYNQSYYKRMPPNSREINSLFKQEYSRKVPPHIFGLKGNEVFQDAEAKMLNNSAYRQELKGVPQNSVEYLDIIKRQLGDMIESAGPTTNEARIIKKTQDKLVNELDKWSKPYKEARALAERKFAREGIEDFFDKKRMEGVPMAQFLKSKEGFEELQKHLRNVPEAQKQLKDMKLVFTNLMPALTGTGLAKLYGTSIKESRSAGQFYEKWMNNLLYSNDKVLADLITNPNWYEDLQKLKKVTDKEKLVGAFIDLMGKAGAQSHAQQ